MKLKLLLAIAVFVVAAWAPTCRAQGDYPRAFVRQINNFTFVTNDQAFPVDGTTLNSWQQTTIVPTGNSILAVSYDPQTLFWQYLGQTMNTAGPEPVTYHYNPAPIFSYIKSIANAIDIAPIEPELTVENDHATTFIAPQNGRSVDTYKTLQDTMSALEHNVDHVTVTIATSTPQNQIANTNNLGIKELIAEGTSNFAGSPSNRRHNIAVGVQQMKGIIVMPGQEFSFNKYLGPVDGEHGFLPELVIKSNNTVPEFGGGLCQVSTTTFRAAMAAGLPITERRNHAYAVSYYSPQGTDATIYPGVVDLKFTNDTPGAILIWPYFKDTNTLVFDFYGTSDGRQVTLEKPVQYDRKTDGSMKATWTRVVVAADGQSATSTFKSTYQPPALFHKSEEFASATPPSELHVGATTPAPQNGNSTQ